jgi:homoserine dehydrogenase
MSRHKKLVIGLFGFGVVGEGIYKVLKQTPTLNATIKKVCIKHPQKKRDIDASLLTTVYDDLLEDPEINVIVELINDTEEAYKIVTKALTNKKHVVSANKKMIAENFDTLVQLQEQHGVSFLYEAAVCGSIPIIRNLEEYYDNDLLQSVSGIVNGSTNYILSKIATENLSYNDALSKAQQLGFAETDPLLDVSGKDAVNKLSILLAHAYGIVVHPQTILYAGINHLQETDAAFANEKGYKIKLIAQAYKLANGRVAAFVLPQFITAENMLYNVGNEYNGVIVESKLADKQFLYGKGAGRYPTSSAVTSDISALQYDYKYEYKKLKSKEKNGLWNNLYLKVYVSFNNWSEINKWDFEQVLEFHSTEKRQYLIGIIHIEKLQHAAWFQDPLVSLILLPEGVLEQDAIITNSLKKVSLQLAGVL